jgi:hypothetical protein
MAYAITVDTQSTVLGDLVMFSGTFTDGGKEIDYSDMLRTVYAVGGHLSNLVSTGILVNTGGPPLNPGSTTIAVNTVDARLHLAAGQTLYSPTGSREGVIASITNATTVVLAAPGTINPLNHTDALFVMGANKPSVTLISTSLDVSVDETNKLVIFESGNRSATSTVSVEDGRWWIIGER